MRTISKPILLALAVLVGIPVALALLINLWLQLPGTKERLQSELGTSLGVTLRFGGMRGLPWGVIRITDVHAQEKDLPFLASAESLSLRPSLLDLLRGKFTIDSCSLSKPVLHVSAFPQPLHAPATAATPSPQSNLVSTLVPSLMPAQPLSKVHGTPTPKSPSKSSLIPRLSIRNGQFQMKDCSNRPIATFSGINLVDHGSCPDLRASTAVIGSCLIFRDLKGQLLSDGDSLSLHGATARIGGGEVTGTLACSSLLNPSPRYSTQLELAGANLKSLLAEASLGSSAASGTVSATLSLEGIAGQGTTMSGKGSILCKDSTIQPVDFLRQLGRILNIEELQLLRLSEAKCVFRIEEGRFLIDDLLLRSDNLMLAAKGPLHPSGELDLQSRLLFNEKLTARLKGFLGSQLSPATEAGYSQIAFHVSGTALNPKTDLLERLTGIRIGGDLGGLGNLLQGFFGKPQPQPSSPQR